MSLSARVKNMKFMRMADGTEVKQEEEVQTTPKLTDLSEWKLPVADIIRQRSKARRNKIRRVGYTQVYQMVDLVRVSGRRNNAPEPAEAEAEPDEPKTEPKIGLTALRANSSFVKRKEQDDDDFPMKKRKN
ncbi:hypothetical protein KL918_005179 [Ogataea parapolymorpha]|uniref:Uncharacterized protein n=1 Tax=Ogataea parapolymorpha (strain ATCC 26012 / BCRC 20466 / JCM 22074 / NRRL Y-7560 / DL-1) TaxID=871575 RepID=W1QCZ1_OGAPD|nr:hypothetical protein HPODL_04082 [Ogataea parapolymorpha DL-1]ESW98455.1 hypothetical protein HPODL_04082 [Ogataea parapolymorpha DL-1]KAG7864858.1 hypothetical protein KL918_005179 [Ogataea parapolymorpha]KAG7873362.1 hypothetical protein KL916_002311 [Ogataea parapolymorpha]KAG7886404.1 hypothetical protein KL938_000057 [Ogataea parapolymorpha]